MTILIFGASGYAGSEIKRTLTSQGHQVYGTYHTQTTHSVDSSMYEYQLGDKEQFHKIVEETTPEIIISCLRGDFTQQLSAHKAMIDYLRKKEQGRLIFLSTANVFDGALEKAHYEDDAPKSESDYGQYKIACEDLIMKSLGERGIIVRIPMIYGKDCPRLNQMIQEIQTNQPIETVSNFQLNYTTNVQIAEWIGYIIGHQLTGIFHIGTKDTFDYYTFQKRLMERLNLGTAKFEVEEEPTTLTQAVLPGRREIPDVLQMSVDELLSFIVP